MKKALLPVFLLVAMACFGQVDISGGKPNWSDRIYVGGGFGLNGGRDYNGYRYFYYSVSPVVGYMITQNFSAGTGITYEHISYPDLKVKTSQYGGFPFVRYNIHQFFLTAEYNFISVDPDLTSEANKREIFSRWLVGGGISQPIGRRGAINLEALYDLSWDATSPFASPWVFRVFFSF